VTAEPGIPIDLRHGTGRAVLWGLESDDLNVNLVAWPAGDGVAEHVNAQVDVLLVVTSGAMTVRIGGATHDLTEGQALLLPKGAARAITACEGGVRYLTAHRRRGPLTLS
jgi:quercetin dioxygenase-like cupin family protein